MLLSINIFAAQTVPIVWAFSPASNQANALRAIIDNANKAQDKYLFVFENKTGAGGTVAVRHTINQTVPSLLMISTSVFVRPVYYPNESYDINDLQPISIIAIGSPLAIISKTYDSLDEVKKQKSASIGIVLGSITEATTRAIQPSISTELQLVPYSSSVDATRDAIGGHVDMSVEFIKDAVSWVDSGKVTIIGVTGSKNIGEHKTLVSQGVKGTDNLVSNYYMLASKHMPKELVLEMHEIINDAMFKQNVVDVWKADEAVVLKMNYKDTTKFWKTQKDFWRK